MVLIAGDPKRFSGVAEARGRDELRVVSDGKSLVKRDLGVEDAQVGQAPGVSLYSSTTRADLVHHYSASAIVAAYE